MVRSFRMWNGSSQCSKKNAKVDLKNIKDLHLEWELTDWLC